MAKQSNRLLIEQMRQVASRHRSFELPGFEASLTGPRAVKDAMGEFGKVQSSMNGTQIPGGLNLPSSAPTPGNVNAAAQFTIQVTRTTANIAASLPVAIFAPVYEPNGYRAFLQGHLPAGVVITSVQSGEKDALADSLVYTFTAPGPLVDTVVLRCSAAPYPSFLQSLVTDRFDVNKLRLTLSDPTQLAQYAEQLTFSTRSMFGLGTENRITPDNFRSPQQNQDAIVDIDVDAKFDKQTGIIMPVIPVAAFSVSLNVFSPRFYQQSARDW